MPYKTNFTCPVCKQDKTKDLEAGQLWAFTVQFQNVRGVYSTGADASGRYYENHSTEVLECCRACAETFGCLPRFDTQGARPVKAEPEPTPEERTIALLRQLLDLVEWRPPV